MYNSENRKKNNKRRNKKKKKKKKNRKKRKKALTLKKSYKRNIKIKMNQKKRFRRRDKKVVSATNLDKGKVKYINNIHKRISFTALNRMKKRNNKNKILKLIFKEAKAFYPPL